MRLPDDYEDHGGGLTPTVISAIVAVVSGYMSQKSRSEGVNVLPVIRSCVSGYLSV